MNPQKITILVQHHNFTCIHMCLYVRARPTRQKEVDPKSFRCDRKLGFLLTPTTSDGYEIQDTQKKSAHHVQIGEGESTETLRIDTVD